MRRRVSVVSSCLTVLLALSSLGATSAHQPPVAASSQSCVQTVRAFYAWYLPHPNDYKAVSTRPQLFSAQIVQLMKADLASEVKYHDAGLDFDPFLNAQNIPSHVAVGSAVQHGSVCRVPVFLKFSNTMPKKPSLVAVLGLQSGHWVFTNFSYDWGDLIKTLKSLQAERIKNGER